MNAIVNRPTPEHIAGLFAQYGIMPISYVYLVSGRATPCCGCAVGVLLVEALGSVDAALAQTRHGNPTDLLSSLTELPVMYLSGLDHGFSYGLSADGQRLWNQFHDDPLYVDGFNVGRAVRGLVLPHLHP